MSTTVVVVVLGTGVVHAFWNAIAKSLHDKFASFALLNIGVALVCWVAWPFVGLPAATAIPYVLAATVLHVGYELLLLGAYRRSDFSQSYPTARGIAPLLVSCGGFVFAGERLSARGLLGIIGIVAGIVALTVGRGAMSRRVGTYWALACGASIAAYSVVDGLGVRAAHNTLRYAVTLFVLQSSVWLIGVVARRPRGWWPGARRASLGALGGVLSVAGYGAVLWAQLRAPLGVVSALRETGVVWAALIGVLVFREGRLRRIMIPAVLVAIGIALLSLD
ncbi:MAG: EamA family transporter [Acidimicrobiales bacterium]